MNKVTTHSMENLNKKVAWNLQVVGKMIYDNMFLPDPIAKMMETWPRHCSKCSVRYRANYWNTCPCCGKPDCSDDILDGP